MNRKSNNSNKCHFYFRHSIYIWKRLVQTPAPYKHDSVQESFFWHSLFRFNPINIQPNKAHSNKDHFPHVDEHNYSQYWLIFIFHSPRLYVYMSCSLLQFPIFLENSIFRTQSCFVCTATNMYATNVMDFRTIISYCAIHHIHTMQMVLFLFSYKIYLLLSYTISSRLFLLSS